MKHPAIALAQLVIQACKAKNIKHIVISPGSRNAPLTIGFSNDPFFTTYSVVDERCAAFFAVGIAQQEQHPVAVICTSGSALLNYYPAFAEAFYSDIPLVVISADRPSDKIDIGDGQTIRQTNVFANHSAYNANLLDADNQLDSNIYELNMALNTAIVRQAPVHINVPFEEPLYLTTTEATSHFKNEPAECRITPLGGQQLSNFIENWHQSIKKMVLVGVLRPGSVEADMILRLADDPSVLVLTETTSNLHHPKFVPYIDKLLSHTEKDESAKELLQPELLLTFGGLVVSKKIKQFLRTFRPKYHYHVDPYKGYDSYFCLTHHFATDIRSFWKAVSQRLKTQESNYHAYWFDIQDNIQQRHFEYLEKIPYSDMSVYKKIVGSIPEKYHIQISNSSPIRYTQLFEFQPEWQIYCNRGTSGIDGSTSTAIGAATANPLPTLFITGDLSFFYDSNALWNNYVPENFRIIIINNGGGGIFRILPGDKTDPHFETYFETPHALTARHLAGMYQWNYQKAYDMNSLDDELATFFEASTRPKILEILTPRKENDKILLEYFQDLKK